MKKLPLLLLSVLSLSISQKTTAQKYQEYMDAFDSLSNAEIISELKSFSSQLKRFEKFGSAFKDEAPEVVALKDQRLEPAFKFDSTIAFKVFEETLETPAEFEQSFEKNGSEIRFNWKKKQPAQSGSSFSIEYVIKKIYFFDGTTRDSNFDNFELSFDFGRNWPIKKRIDSIEVEAVLQYTKGFDEVTINRQKPKVSYQGKEITLKKIDKNTIWFSRQKGKEENFYQGLNKEGKVLDSKGSSSSDLEDGGFEKIFSPILQPLDKIIAQAQADSAVDPAVFRQKYAGQIENLVKNIQLSDTRHYKVRYHGMVEGVRLFFAKDKGELTGKRVFTSTTKNDIHLYATKDSSFFYDNDGKEIAAFNHYLREVNNHFYEDGKAFYYVDHNKKLLQKLPYYNVEAVNTKYVLAQTDKDEPYFLLNSINQNMGTFDAISGSENCVLALDENNTLTVINSGGKESIVRNVTQIGDFENNYAVFKSNEKYGFFNVQGTIVVPAEYDYVKDFSTMTTYTNADNLLPVRKNDKWGFVNNRNEQVIPFIYEDVAPFSFGITMAKKDGNWGLIDTKNRTIVPFNNGGSYGLSTNFGKRFYNFGDKNFDHLGRPSKR